MQMHLAGITLNRLGLNILLFYWLLMAGLFIAPVNADIDNLRLKQLSPNEGLSQGNVTSLLIDKTGFLWLATEGGLNYFDGYKVNQLLDPDDIFADAHISYIFETTDGIIWISSLYSGLYSLDPKTLIFKKVISTEIDSDPNNVLEVIHIVEGKNDKLWLAVSQNIMLLDRNSGQTETLFSLKDLFSEKHVIRKILLDDDILYIASSVGLFAMDTKTKNWQQIANLAHNSTEKIAYDKINTKSLYLKKQTLWFGTVEGLYSINTANINNIINNNASLPEVKTWESFRNIWKLQASQDGFYVATDDGLYALNIENETFQRVWQFNQSRHEISDNNIIDIVEDKLGGLWLASKNSGAFYWDPQQVNFQNVNNSLGSKTPLSNDTVWTLLQTSDDILWIGTENGLNKFNLKTQELSSYLINEDKKAIGTASSISYIMRQSDTSLWLDTGEGLSLFDLTQEKIIPLKLSEKDKTIFNMVSWGYYQDSNANLWFMNDSGFYRYNFEKNKLETISYLNQHLDPSLSYLFLGEIPNRPNSILISLSGELWLFDDKNQKLTLIYEVTPNQPQNFISADSVAFKDNLMWLTIPGHALIAIDINNFQLIHQYNISNILPTNVIYGVQIDDDKDIWLSSHHGLLKIDHKTQYVKNYTYNDGLTANEFNSGAFTKLKDGRFVYGSMKGFTLFDPELIKSNKKNLTDNNVKITEVSLLSRRLSPSIKNLNNEIIKLNYDDIGFKVNFSTINFKNQNNTYYRINLAGDKTIEYPKTKENYIIFPQLQPGQYRFSVTAIEPNNGIETKSAQLFLTVNYAPWKSPTAYLLYFLSITSIILIWLYKRRVQQNILKQAHKEIAESEERLQLALRGSSSGQWDWQVEQECFFEPRINDELGYTSLPLSLSLEQHHQLIHPDDLSHYQQTWFKFINDKGASFECIYRLKNNDGGWLWYKDLGKIVSVNTNGKIERIAGTYTNITHTKANEEKAKLFGQAFKQTRDWVVILDNKSRPIAANQSFYDAFDLTEKILFTSFIKTLGIDRNKLRFYKHILSSITVNNFWQGEEYVVTKQGKEYPSLIKITANSEQGGSIDNYVIVLTDITEQKKAEKNLRNLANYDVLTGLPNRLLLFERLQHAINRTNRSRNNIALFFIDLDRFKQINDSLGHDMGDVVLQQVAQRLRKTLRNDDTIARFGGDEFVVLLESYQGIDDVRHIAQKIISEVDLPIQLETRQLRISPSIGIAFYPNDAQNSMELLKRADVAMYHAKEKGGSSFHFYDESMELLAKANLSLENKLKQAVTNDDFINYYQPIVNITNGTIEGFELLLRWQNIDEPISPFVFIPVAEEIGLIILLTKALFERGINDLKEWQKLGQSPYLSINLSARHLEDLFLIDEIKYLLEKSQLSASNIRFEITESSLMKDHQKSIQIMKELNQLGIKLAIDDFGTGYSSLQYLKKFPMEIIKIDLSFVKNIGIDRSDEAIIEAILLLAKRLNKYCIAEGVETKQQMDFLVERGCYLLQGYLFSKPIPANLVPDLLNQFKTGTN